MKTFADAAAVDPDMSVAIAAERERIARDLHDSVTQLLVGMGLMLSELRDDAPDSAWHERLTQLVDLARQGERETRDAIHALLFSGDGRRRLVERIGDECRRFETETGTSVAVRVAGRERSMTTVVSDPLVRVVREALVNVGRHARATSVVVHIRFARGGCGLTIVDDGVGCDRPVLDGRPRLGLVALERMIDRAGGSLTVRTRPPRGTVVEAWLPG